MPINKSDRGLLEIVATSLLDKTTSAGDKADMYDMGMINWDGSVSDEQYEKISKLSDLDLVGWITILMRED